MTTAHEGERSYDLDRRTDEFMPCFPSLAAWAATAPDTVAAARLRQAGVTMPLRCGDDGEILDARDECRIVIDINRELPDTDVKAIAEIVVAAVNRIGGVA